jgi:hypothetical protein
LMICFFSTFNCVESFRTFENLDAFELCLAVLHRRHLKCLAFELCLSTCTFPAVITCIRKFNVYMVLVGGCCYIYIVYIYIYIYVHGPGTGRTTT